MSNIIRNALSVLWLSAIFVAPSSQADIKLIAYFSNHRASNSGHEYGYGLSIWKQGEHYLGAFTTFQGLIGDSPRYELHKLNYQPITGALSFECTSGAHHYLDVNRKKVKGAVTHQYKGVVDKTQFKASVTKIYKPAPWNKQLNTVEQFEIPRKAPQVYPWTKL